MYIYIDDKNASVLFSIFSLFKFLDMIRVKKKEEANV